MMAPALIAFALATTGSKIILALVVIYGLLPTTSNCTLCDGETVPLTLRPGVRAFARLLRLQRRWCPHCGETMLVRGHRDYRVRVGPPEKSHTDPTAERDRPGSL